MRILEVIPSRVWKNAKTGQTASPCGSTPWGSEADRADWTLETVGYTWRNDNGTIGLGRVPAKTLEEAQSVMRANNDRLDAIRRDWLIRNGKA